MGAYKGAWGPMATFPYTQERRPGDWQCYACKNVNYANRMQCNKCQIPKQVFISKAGIRMGDWICPECSNHNYADKTVCNKCKAPKAEGTPLPMGNLMRPGDWMCPHCHNHNYANRQSCNKCGAPKE